MKEKGIKVLSLFDGMACGMLAFQKAGISVSEYIAYETDKFAVKTATYNFPGIKEMGDVFDADFSQYKNVDFIVGGSPCTFWSVAQSPNKREKTASGQGWDLFSQYTRALHEVRPKYFIYENNKSMAKGIYNGISESFGFEPICINSALVSAQNRKRLYWVGKRNADNTYNKVDIEQPDDKGILLRDVLIGNDLTCNDKAYTLTDSYDGAAAWNTLERKQRNMIAEPVAVLVRIGTYPTSDGRLLESQGMRIYSIEGKSVTICSGSGGIGTKTGLYAIPVKFNGDIPIKAIFCANGKEHSVYEVTGGNITIKEKRYPVKLQDGYYIIRKPTISECKTLQTIPEWYEFPVSNTQAYKMLGNGWTVDVIVHLIKGILK